MVSRVSNGGAIPSAQLSERTALVLYGSETGNAQDVADEIGRVTQRLRFDTVVDALDSIEIRDLLKYKIVIIAISTTGQGEFPQNARSFWSSLLSSRLRLGVLRRVLFTSFGLGDSSYPRFNVVHRMLHGRLVQLGAKPFCERGEGNEQHPEGHSAGFRAWILELRQALLATFPLPLDQSAIADSTFIEPKWHLEMSRVAQGIDRLASPSVDDRPSESLVPISDSHLATLNSIERVTPPAHFQDVRLLDLEIPTWVDYGPGAVAVIYPKNFPEDVEAFIRCQSWESVADVPLVLVARDSGGSRWSPSPLSQVDRTVFTLRALLTDHLDILSIPRRSFFSALSFFTRQDTEEEQYQHERVLELANPELIDELWDYTTRPRRTILEVMPDFPSIKIPWRYACTVLPVMRGRQFSIASGGLLKEVSAVRAGGIARPSTRIQLLIAIADPPNPIIRGRKRHGVCSRYVTTLRKAQRINVGMQPGYLGVKSSDYQAPMILIGPGTGIAPMRSLIYDRIHAHQLKLFESAGRTLQGCMLFFGCRGDSDLFFGDEWASLQDEGLKTVVAFSRRSGEPKTYVQDKLRQEGQAVFEAIDQLHGRVFVCGSSGNMPKGVRQALLDIIAEGGNLTEAEADAYLDRLEKQGRYKQETW